MLEKEIQSFLENLKSKIIRDAYFDDDYSEQFEDYIDGYSFERWVDHNPWVLDLPADALSIYLEFQANAAQTEQTVDTHPKRFLFLLHRQRRIFFFFGKTKKKKMGG